MEITERNLKGVFELTPEVKTDHRGFFMRTFDDSIFSTNKIHRHWKQENHSRSLLKGTLRGLHFQFPPFAETKLVRCIRGKIQDVFVDLRLNSPSFGNWDSIILSEDNFKMIYIPRGFAHGFVTLTDDCDVLYKVDNYYNVESEGGILWNDSTLNINWNTNNPILSDKDRQNMLFSEFTHKFKGIQLTQDDL